jgi:SAM-dependent methyltransferase
MSIFASGCCKPLEEWMQLNRTQIFTHPELKCDVSPFPPVELMTNVSGLQNEQDFAAHGTDIYRSLTTASSKPLSEFSSILDFGCGCGRLARMFKGHPGRIAGCDIDARHVEWVNNNLEFMEAKISKVNPPIPYIDNEFEAIISISIFTHLTEQSQDQFLSELHRVCMPEGRLFLTVHGKRALERALNEPGIRAMLDMDDHRFKLALQAFSENRHGFILQFGHLTTIDKARELFEYGIAFIPEKYLRARWGKWFDIIAYHHGGIHDFQDIVVLKPKK